MIRIKEEISSKPLQRIITLHFNKVKEFELFSVDFPDPNTEIKINPVDGSGYAVIILFNLSKEQLDGKSITITTLFYKKK